MHVDPQVPTALRATAVILVLEALGLVAAAAFLVVDTARGGANSVGRALWLAALFALAAAVFVLSARGILHLRPSARSPVIVLELCALAVAYGFYQAHRETYTIVVLVPSAVVLYLLFTPPARRALDREPPD